VGLNALLILIALRWHALTWQGTLVSGSDGHVTRWNATSTRSRWWRSNNTRLYRDCRWGLSPT